MIFNYLLQFVNQKLVENYFRILDFYSDDYFKLYYFKNMLNFSYMNFIINIKEGKKIVIMNGNILVFEKLK